ncbi:5-oxoprolinase subunit PxpB [Polaribacter aestuariivivens]|uniref:5-oxoprolinase subunit PxpB n=1 Tax=Polaribacter aestuariivivens TaxID=2304626 RepID=UPI003F4945FD
MFDKITYKPFGEKAILIEWEPRIDVEISEEILLFQSKIKAQKNTSIIDYIVAYNSLTLIFKHQIHSFQIEVEHLKKIYASKTKTFKKASFLWEIPVCYDLEFGIDLQEMSEKLNLQTSEIIKLHTQSLYRVYFVGFLPGFLYLGGLDEKIHFNRKSNPRLKVPKGAVGIGGKQTGIYPSDSAGGWNIIGKTPIDFFNINRQQPCFANSGDFIKFVEISKNDFLKIQKEVKQNTYTLSKTLKI